MVSQLRFSAQQTAGHFLKSAPQFVDYAAAYFGPADAQLQCTFCSVPFAMQLGLPPVPGHACTQECRWGLNMHSQRSKLWRVRPCNDKPLSGLCFSTFNTLGLAPAHGFPVRPDTPKHQQLVEAITCLLKKYKIPDGPNMKPPVYQTPRLVLSDCVNQL
jgi:hypothetical protein